MVDIDGMPRTPKDATPLTKPVIAIVAGDADPLPEYDAALDALLADGKGSRITLDGVTHFGMVDLGRHFGMVDLGLIVGPISGITGTQGPTGPTSAAQVTLQFIHTLD